MNYFKSVFIRPVCVIREPGSYILLQSSLLKSHYLHLKLFSLRTKVRGGHRLGGWGRMNYFKSVFIRPIGVISEPGSYILLQSSLLKSHYLHLKLFSLRTKVRGGHGLGGWIIFNPPSSARSALSANPVLIFFYSPPCSNRIIHT